MVTAEVEPGRRQHRIGMLVIGRRPLQLEEQNLRLGLGGALLDALEQRPPLGVCGVGRKSQRRVRPGAPDEVLDPFKLPHRLAELAGVELRDPARI